MSALFPDSGVLQAKGGLSVSEGRREGRTDLQERKNDSEDHVFVRTGRKALEFCAVCHWRRIYVQ